MIKKIVNDFEKRVQDRVENLSDNQKTLVNDSLDKISIIYNDNATPEQKKEAAQWLVDNAGLTTNDNGKKAYFNTLGGNRKIKTIKHNYKNMSQKYYQYFVF